MNIFRYENAVHKEADRAHAAAQQSGKPSDYVKAAELYEKCGDFEQAAQCRNAAESLAK
jgi:uncharacterized protein HemY